MIRFSNGMFAFLLVSAFESAEGQSGSWAESVDMKIADVLQECDHGHDGNFLDDE